jgi:putative ABC transport system permease protein
MKTAFMMINFLGNLLQDLRHAARTLVKARAFTAVCVTSLGLGMGVVILILLFLNTVLKTPPGVHEDGLAELVIRPSGQLLAETGEPFLDTWSYPDYLDVRAGASGMAITGWSRAEAHFKPAGESRTIPLSPMYVSTNYFSTVGVTLPLGRGFTAADDATRAEPEAVVSHILWQVRLGGDPGIIGRTITIDQTEYLVVGVAPERFRGHRGGLDESSTQLWLPLSRHPRLRAGLTATGNARLDRDAAWLRVIARLSPGVTLAQADASVASVVAGLAARHPSSHREKTGGVEPYFPPGAEDRDNVGFAKMMIFGLTSMVLLIVGLNISGMLLVRSAMRERELAVRMAMGASRWRLMQSHLAEALVMATFGGSLACAVLFGGPLVVAWTFDMWGPALEFFRPDVWVVMQCIGLCFATSLVLGVLPALRFSRPSIVSALKSDTAGSGRRVGRLQRFTAAAQAGIAVPFLVIAGVQFDQARVAALADVGFKPQGLYAARFTLSAIGATDEDRQLFLRALQVNLAQAPGIASVSVGDGLPLDFIYRNTRVALDGQSAFVQAHTTRIGPGYLETLGTRLLAGRTIGASDLEGAERVVVLSEPLARQLIPAGDPIGARVAFALQGDERQIYTVVGVTADLVSTQMGNPRPQLFVSLAQHPAQGVLLIARGAPSDPAVQRSFENATADALRQIPGQPAQPGSGQPDTGSMLGELITGEWLIDNSRSDLLTSSGVGGVAAAVALVLTALGVYGVIAFMVATRTREIGVRVALGASRGHVLRGVLVDAMKLVVPGIGVGLLLAVLWVRLADPAWYPLGGVEPLVYTFAAGTAFMVAALAGIPSARRAAAVDPMIAMRSE